MTSLNPRQRDRALGAILGAALGDALGAPYEFSTESPQIHLRGVGHDLVGGGTFGWAPGEWTDDTAMSVPLLRVLAAGNVDLEHESVLDELAAAWWAWAREAKDVGVQTRTVLDLPKAPTAAQARASAAALHAKTGRTAGNGSLMRTPAVAIGYLGSEDGEARTARAARAISELTHHDADAGDACVIWSLAIRRAALVGVVDLDATLENAADLGAIDDATHKRWGALVAEARSHSPAYFTNNGWVVHAFQAAVACLEIGGVLAKDESGGAGARYLRVIEAAINAAGDTDTIAAIAGALAGAEAGYSVFPMDLTKQLHGWPDLTGNDLARLVAKASLER